MSDTEVLLKRRTGDVAVLTLNRPDVLNAISPQLALALADTVRDLSADDTLRAIILTGTGRAFSAGVDLKALSGAPSIAEAFNWSGEDSLFEIVKACPHPIIAAVNGFAITGGLELAMMADMIIASDSAKFADTHARVGITPSWGLSQNLPRRVGLSRARQMSFTGQFIDAQTACDWGLVNEVVPAGTELLRAEEIAEAIAQTDPITLRKLRGLMIEGSGLPLDEALAKEKGVFDVHIQTVTTEALEQNRQAVTARGRRQTDKET